MPDPFATLGDLARTAEDALGACRSRAASLRTRHEALVAEGFGDAKGSSITDDPMRDVFDAFDAPARLTLVERFAEALETSHASSEPASRRTDSRSSFVRLEARLRTSAKRCEAHLARGARGAALVSHIDGLRALWTAEGALAYKSTTEDFLERVERNRAALLRARGAARSPRRCARRTRRDAAEPRKEDPAKRSETRTTKTKTKTKTPRTPPPRSPPARVSGSRRASSARARLPARRTRRIHVMFVGRSPNTARARSR